MKFEVFKFKFSSFVYILFITFIIQHTGCLFFPNNLTCLNVSWLNEDNMNLSYELELNNKVIQVWQKIISLQRNILENFNYYFLLKSTFTEISEHFDNNLTKKLSQILNKNIILFCLQKTKLLLIFFFFEILKIILKVKLLLKDVPKFL